MSESNSAARSYYLISETLESALLNNSITKTVTIGDATFSKRLTVFTVLTV